MDLLESYWWQKRVDPGANAWAWEPPSPWRPWEACLLVSRPVRDPITEVAGKAMPRARHLGALSLDGPGLVFLRLSLG